MIDKWLPIVTKSPNLREHWSKSHRRRKSQAYWIKYLFSLYPDEKIEPPCLIELTRTGPKLLDYDNMVFSLKGVRDSISDYINPGLAAGQADSDKRISWKYDQKKGKLGVNIKIESIL